MQKEGTTEVGQYLRGWEPRCMQKELDFDSLMGIFSILTRAKEEKMGPTEDCRFGKVKMIFQFYP